MIRTITSVVVGRVASVLALASGALIAGAAGCSACGHQRSCGERCPESNRCTKAFRT